MEKHPCMGWVGWYSPCGVFLVCGGGGPGVGRRAAPSVRLRLTAPSKEESLLGVCVAGSSQRNPSWVQLACSGWQPIPKAPSEEGAIGAAPPLRLPLKRRARQPHSQAPSSEGAPAKRVRVPKIAPERQPSTEKSRRIPAAAFWRYPLPHQPSKPTSSAPSSA